MKKTMGLWSVLVAVALLSSGCSMLGLKRDLQAFDEQYRELRVTVECDQPQQAAVILVLWALDDSGVNSFGVTHCGVENSYKLNAGRYYLIAYADSNEDTQYQEATEYAGVYGGKVLEVSPGKEALDLKLELLAPGKVQLPVEVSRAKPEEISARFKKRSDMLGTVVSLDDPLFTNETGAMGLWTPLQFAENIGFPIYFLDEYDPSKIPVLFVHGSGGHPAIWKTAVASLDRTKYQPWLVFYPSGARIDDLGARYARYMDELQLKLGFKEFIVVAHSMGGLVSRSMLLHYAQLDNRAKVPLYITFATPWGGHSAASMGVDHAPVVVPAWYDMVPGSTFLQQLVTEPMPPETRHYLFFAYRGKGSMVGRHVNNDGTVSLKSQLRLPIQHAATRVAGIDANHVDILSDPTSLDLFRGIMDGYIAEH